MIVRLTEFHIRRCLIVVPEMAAHLQDAVSGLLPPAERMPEWTKATQSPYWMPPLAWEGLATALSGRVYTSVSGTQDRTIPIGYNVALRRITESLAAWESHPAYRKEGRLGTYFEVLPAWLDDQGLIHKRHPRTASTFVALVPEHSSYGGYKVTAWKPKAWSKAPVGLPKEAGDLALHLQCENLTVGPTEH